MLNTWILSREKKFLALAFSYFTPFILLCRQNSAGTSHASFLRARFLPRVHVTEVTWLFLEFYFSRVCAFGSRNSLAFKSNLTMRRGGLMLVRSTTERAVLVRALAGDIVLRSWKRNFTLTVSLSTQVVKCLPANLMLRATLRRTSTPPRGEKKHS